MTEENFLVSKEIKMWFRYLNFLISHINKPSVNTTKKQIYWNISKLHSDLLTNMKYQGVKNFTLVTHHLSGVPDMCQWHICYGCQCQWYIWYAISSIYISDVPSVIHLVYHQWYVWCAAPTDPSAHPTTLIPPATPWVFRLLHHQVHMQAKKSQTVK